MANRGRPKKTPTKYRPQLKPIYDHRQLPIILSPLQVKRLLGDDISETTIRKHCKENEPPFHNARLVCGRWKIPKADILEYFSLPSDERIGYSEFLSTYMAMRENERWEIRRMLDNIDKGKGFLVKRYDS